MWMEAVWTHVKKKWWQHRQGTTTKNNSSSKTSPITATVFDLDGITPSFLGHKTFERNFITRQLFTDIYWTLAIQFCFTMYLFTVLLCFMFSLCTLLRSGQLNNTELIDWASSTADNGSPQRKRTRSGERNFGFQGRRWFIFRYSWRKMEAAAQNIHGWRQWKRQDVGLSQVKCHICNVPVCKETTREIFLWLKRRF